jgi:hypothetical protein
MNKFNLHAWVWALTRGINLSQRNKILKFGRPTSGEKLHVVIYNNCKGSVTEIFPEKFLSKQILWILVVPFIRVSNIEENNSAWSLSTVMSLSIDTFT